VGGLDSPTTGGGGISDKTKKTVIIIVVLLIIVGIMVGVPQIRDMYMDAFKDLFGGK
jgi:hypothetical protein